MSSYNTHKSFDQKRNLKFYAIRGPMSSVEEDPNMHIAAHLYASDRNSLFMMYVCPFSSTGLYHVNKKVDHTDRYIIDQTISTSETHTPRSPPSHTPSYSTPLLLNWTQPGPPGPPTPLEASHAGSSKNPTPPAHGTGEGRIILVFGLGVPQSQQRVCILRPQSRTA
jgi:hypothetical protein